MRGPRAGRGQEIIISAERETVLLGAWKQPPRFFGRGFVRVCTHRARGRGHCIASHNLARGGQLACPRRAGEGCGSHGAGGS